MTEAQSLRERARRHLEAMQRDNPNQGELAVLFGPTAKRERDARFFGRLHGEPAGDEDEGRGDE